MEKPKENKGYVPVDNKTGREDPAPTGSLVRIRFKPGRAGEGAVVQADGTALVSPENAKYWVEIGYAEFIQEGE